MSPSFSLTEQFPTDIPSQREVILLDEDEPALTDEQRDQDLIREQIREYGRHRNLSRSIEVIDLGSDSESEHAFLAKEADREAELEQDDLIEFVDLTEESKRPARSKPHPVTRNPPLTGSQVLLHVYHHQGYVLKNGTVVEIENAIGRFNIEFLKIVSVIYDNCVGQVMLRGLPYTRTKFINGQLPRKLNEICLILDIDDDDPRLVDVQNQTDTRQVDDQLLLEVKLEQVKSIRNMHSTNESFPANRFEFSSQFQTENQVAEKGPLVCRWKYILHYRNAAMRSSGRAYEWALVHMRSEEANLRFRKDDETRLNQWRGGKIPGGSFSPAGAGIPSVDIEDGPHGYTPGLYQAADGQMYTCGDVFCGAGGASRGMERAGFKVTFGVDHWHHACATYQMNFPGTELYSHDVNIFIKNQQAKYRIDVLHLSPPCQVWSPAHTVAGARDDENIAVLFSCAHLIPKIRPRYFTLEQTFGILHRRCRPYFNVLVLGFTEHGYSVRWKIVHLATWGLPQARKRLIMVGACPGERLPPFPGPTHSKDPEDGLQPFVTAREALDCIGPMTSLHNLDQMRPFEVVRPEWDPHGILRRTITTSGGQNYHYSGKRDLTLREFACLQGFPTWHKFVAPSIKKQIGNAFPPCVVEVLYDHLRGWLEAEDRIVPHVRRELPIPAGLDEDVAFFPLAQLPIAIRRTVSLIDLDQDVEDDVVVTQVNTRHGERIVIEVEDETDTGELDVDEDMSDVSSVTLAGKIQIPWGIGQMELCHSEDEREMSTTLSPCPVNFVDLCAEDP